MTIESRQNVVQAMSGQEYPHIEPEFWNTLPTTLEAAKQAVFSLPGAEVFAAGMTDIAQIPETAVRELVESTLTRLDARAMVGLATNIFRLSDEERRAFEADPATAPYNRGVSFSENPTEGAKEKAVFGRYLLLRYLDFKEKAGGSVEGDNAKHAKESREDMFRFIRETASELFGQMDYDLMDHYNGIDPQARKRGDEEHMLLPWAQALLAESSTEIAQEQNEDAEQLRMQVVTALEGSQGKPANTALISQIYHGKNLLPSAVRRVLERFIAKRGEDKTWDKARVQGVALVTQFMFGIFGEEVANKMDMYMEINRFPRVADAIQALKLYRYDDDVVDGAFGLLRGETKTYKHARPSKVRRHNATLYSYPTIIEDLSAGWSPHIESSETQQQKVNEIRDEVRPFAPALFADFVGSARIASSIGAGTRPMSLNYDGIFGNTNVMTLVDARASKAKLRADIVEEQAHALHARLGKLAEAQDGNRTIPRNAIERMPNDTKEQLAHILVDQFTEQDTSQSFSTGNLFPTINMLRQIPVAIVQLRTRVALENLWDQGVRGPLSDAQLDEIVTLGTEDLFRLYRENTIPLVDVPTTFGATLSLRDPSDGTRYEKPAFSKYAPPLPPEYTDAPTETEQKEAEVDLGKLIADRFGAHWAKDEKDPKGYWIYLGLLAHSVRDYSQAGMEAYVQNADPLEVLQTLRGYGIADEYLRAA